MKITLLTGQTYDISQDVGMNIKVISSRSSGKLVLHIDQKNRIPVLSVPKYCSRRRAVNFVNDNMDWILESLSKLPEIKHFGSGEKISLFGRELEIKHCPQQRGGVWIDCDYLCVSGGAEFLHRRIRDYIREQAQKKFYEYSKNLANKIGCKLNGVIIKDTKSRWGSCSTLHNINYSWRIALAPQYVIEYLMAHEVSHLKHPDHSDEFWSCVEKLCHEWQRGHSWLRRYGKTLYVYE